MDMNEVICSCVGTTAQDIKDAMNNGATTLEEVQEATNAGTCCGCCIDQIEGIMIAK
ncbi:MULTISPECIES: (2Fe-2S)-binding protein [Clostridium]|uniref:(2Fe-2S)-binding protein n=1 Tax=Clostridium botulinum TaxID=1491 RepID=A0A6B4QE36_CLOBO|nr:MULTISPECIES: (2Fe-2S)-binding protein [Clostridium]EES48914.1 nitrogen-fixing NifU domain protein [Clostridium botulinum E1 str. 'BoNT E Beluga']KIL08174.1 (2Fe-2S)-binding protein [Clostridium botulinum]MBN1036825.1 (2Fe-2S)-binding protein [Clostridium botulinum]MBN1043527.1 (2Fe-2S)-binding protein [Clostridium botulinum]MBN1053497.1 (2Fe-2S)-binding protein [Clostridium botulinum]